MSLPIPRPILKNLRHDHHCDSATLARAARAIGTAEALTAAARVITRRVQDRLGKLRLHTSPPIAESVLLEAELAARLWREAETAE